MDEDQEIALGSSVVLLVICVTCVSWGLYHVLRRTPITEESSEEDYVSLLTPTARTT
jgi:hypothetical protein